MPVDFQQAVANYGYVGLFAQTNPEVANILNQAVAGEWDSARFERALWDTGWWKSTSETRRQLQIQQTTDPAAYQSTLDSKTGLVRGMAQRLGLNENQGHSQHVARLALENSWTDEQVQQFLVDSSSNRNVGGALTGASGEIENSLRKTISSYGLNFTDDWVTMVSREIAAGRQTLGGMDNEMRQRAKQYYPMFASSFDEGLTLKDIAQPFISTMANTLEIDETMLNVTDGHIKRALAGKDGQPLSLWEFERTLKNDARWDKTKQARNETYSVLQQIGQDWGFSY